jgi:hypothetical protein
MPRQGSPVIQGGIASGMGLLYTYFKKKMGVGKGSLHQTSKIVRSAPDSSWMTNAYLNARFQQKLSKRRCKPRKVTPLVSMNVSTLERAIPAMSEMAFSDIVEDRIQEDPMLGRPFEAASSFVQRGTPGRLHKHIELMHELSKEMQQDFEMKDDSSPTDQSSPQ